MENNEIVYLYLDDIIPNRFQPREVFDDQALKELAVSIKEHGVIQPIIVRKVENKYEIIAGERRYKASTMAGLTKIPAIVKNLDDKESSKVALIENLQRRDLTPIEEARTYQKILDLEGGMTQEELAQTMGKTQSVVSNKLRLLALPDEVQDALLNEKISERHARSLLNISNKNDQIRMLDKVIANKMTVRELDKEIKDMNDNQGNNNAGGFAVGSSMSTNVGSNSMGTSIGSGTGMGAGTGENPIHTMMPNAPISENSSVLGGVGNVPVMNPFHSPLETEHLGENNSSNNELKPVSPPPVAPTLSPVGEADFGKNKEEVEDINPTAVDIDKIREHAVDIGGGVKSPSISIKDLMKDISNQKKEDYKFVPGNESSLNNNVKPMSESTSMIPPVKGDVSFMGGIGTSKPTSFETTPTGNGAFDGNLSGTTNDSLPINSFLNGGNSNVQGNIQDVSLPQDGSHVASSITNRPLGLNPFGNASSNVGSAIQDIKNTISSLEGKGYQLSFEESDLPQVYQITIKVNKTM